MSLQIILQALSCRVLRTMTVADPVLMSRIVRCYLCLVTIHSSDAFLAHWISLSNQGTETGAALIVWRVCPAKDQVTGAPVNKWCLQSDKTSCCKKKTIWNDQTLNNIGVICDWCSAASSAYLFDTFCPDSWLPGDNLSCEDNTWRHGESQPFTPPTDPARPHYPDTSPGKWKFCCQQTMRRGVTVSYPRRRPTNKQTFKQITLIFFSN